jgi:hypothetical protein
MNDNSLILEYYAIEPLQFSVVIELSIYQSFSLDLTPPKLNLRMVLASEIENDKRQLTLNFYEIKSLVFSQPSLSLFQIPFLEIVSLSDRQLENINFKALDKEESISFYFNSFEFFIS